MTTLALSSSKPVAPATQGYISYLLEGDAEPAIRVTCPLRTSEAAGADSCASLLLTAVEVDAIAAGDTQTFKKVVHRGADLVDQLSATGCPKHSKPVGMQLAEKVWAVGSGLDGAAGQTLIEQVREERVNLVPVIRMRAGRHAVVNGVPVYRGRFYPVDTSTV